MKTENTKELLGTGLNRSSSILTGRTETLPGTTLVL